MEDRDMILEESVWYRVAYIQGGEILGYSDQFDNIKSARKVHQMVQERNNGVAENLVAEVVKETIKREMID